MTALATAQGGSYGAGSERTKATRMPKAPIRHRPPEHSCDVVRLKSQDGLRPTHDPLHRASFQPGADLAIRRTRSSLTKKARHELGHEIPLGALVTVPLPEIATKTTLPTGPGSDDRAPTAASEATAAAATTRSRSRAILTGATIARRVATPICAGQLAVAANLSPRLAFLAAASTSTGSGPRPSRQR